MDYFKNACRLHTHFMVHRYLMSNTTGRLDGAEKAIRHAELCKFYVAAIFNYPFEDRVRIDHEDEYQAVHDATQELTDYLDEKIGFPIDDSRPEYDELAPKFFELFHRLAMRALAGAMQNGTEQKSTMTLQERVKNLISKNGGLRAAARAIDIDASYFLRLSNGEKENPSDAVLEKLGLRAVVTYELLEQK